MNYSPQIAAVNMQERRERSVSQREYDKFVAKDNIARMIHSIGALVQLLSRHEALKQIEIAQMKLTLLSENVEEWSERKDIAAIDFAQSGSWRKSFPEKKATNE